MHPPRRRARLTRSRTWAPAVLAGLLTLVTLAACRSPAPSPEVSGPALPGAHPPGPPALELDLERLLEQHRDELGPIAADPAGHRLQILVAQVEPATEPDRPSTLRRTGFRVDEEYFYPASAVKLCGVVAAVELMKDLKRSFDPENLLNPGKVVPLQ